MKSKTSLQNSLKNFKLCNDFRGTYHSKKMDTDMQYANNMEYLFLKWMDENPEIIEFFHENLAIPYYLDSKRKTFFPDFEVHLKDGKEIWELKNSGKDRVTQHKKIAAEKYASDNSYNRFKIITAENMIDHMMEFL